MNCEHFRDALAELAAGRLGADAERELEAHRAACADCAALARRRRRPPRLVAFAFLGAFAASILTLIYTGLNVRDPDSVDAAAPEPERAVAVPDGDGDGEVPAARAGPAAVPSDGEGEPSATRAEPDVSGPGGGEH